MLATPLRRASSKTCRSPSLTTMNYFCINHGNQMFFFQFEVIITVLVSSFRFIWIPRYLSYGSTSITNIFIMLQCGGSTLGVRIWRLYRRPILTRKVDPRAVRVNYNVITSTRSCPVIIGEYRSVRQSMTTVITFIIISVAGCRSS